MTGPSAVEAYAAYAPTWLAASAPLASRTRQFAKWSAIGSLALDGLGIGH